jgi:hypothetical protein
MPKGLLILLIFILNNSLSSNNALREFLFKHKIDSVNNKIILIVNTNDCVNCYKPLNLFVQDLKKSEFDNIYIVLSGIYERQIPIYLNKIFDSEFKFKNAIVDEEFSSKYSFNSFTTAHYLEGSKIIHSQTIKNDWSLNLDKFKEIDKTNFKIKKDSIDITENIKGNFLELNVSNDSLSFIFDRDLRSLFRLNLNSRKIDKQIFIQEILEKKLKDNLFFMTKDSSCFGFNMKVSKQIPSLKDNLYLVNLDYANNKLYIGYRIVNRVKNGLNIRVDYLPIIAVFDLDLNFLYNHYIPQFMPNDGTYLDVLFMQIISSEKVKLQFTDGRRYKDTLFATFKLIKNDFCSIIENYKVTLPNDLPKVSKRSKLPIYYKVNLLIKNENPFSYYFSEIERLYYATDNRTINYSYPKSAEDTLVYNNILFFDESKLTTLYTINKSQYIINYNFLENKVKDKVILNNYVLNDFKFYRSKLYGVKTWPNKTYFYIYDIFNY